MAACLPIGGLKEKILAAKRAKLATVILPKRNQKDLEEIPKHLLKGIEIDLRRYHGRRHQDGPPPTGSRKTRVGRRHRSTPQNKAGRLRRIQASGRAPVDGLHLPAWHYRGVLRASMASGRLVGPARSARIRADPAPAGPVRRPTRQVFKGIGDDAAILKTSARNGRSSPRIC